MQYRRMRIEVESPEELGYGNIRCNLSESSIADQRYGRYVHRIGSGGAGTQTAHRAARALDLAGDFSLALRDLVALSMSAPPAVAHAASSDDIRTAAREL